MFFMLQENSITLNSPVYSIAFDRYIYRIKLDIMKADHEKGEDETYEGDFKTN